MRYVAIRSEGSLLPYDLLDKILADQVAGQKPADFGLPKGQRLIDEISRVWADAQNLWSNFKRRRQSLTERDPYGTSITRTWIVSLLSDPEMLGFDLKLQASAVVVNNATFAISHRDGDGDDAIPVHIEGCKIDLDRRLHTKLRTSPQAMLQDFLNNSERSSWGILTNGVTLRLLRDSSRTSRPTYLEFDLESILEGNRFNEFALLYRLCHRSRFPRPGQEPSDCLLEKYYLDSIEQGLRIREKLSGSVKEALEILGAAFLQHPANSRLRADYQAGKLSAEKLHRQLLLLVYRLLFLMVAEERGLIVSMGERADRNQKIYDEWYSVTRLRERASRIVEASPFGDLWVGLKQTFSLFEFGLDTNALAIPPLNGDLFDEKRAIPDLAQTELHNHDLLLAIRHLSLFKAGNTYQRVNYSGLDVEELGSVYESLLEYKPVVTRGDTGFKFALNPGLGKKSTGSYYTRPELVHELIESALVPVMTERIEQAEKASSGKNLVEEAHAKEKALLGIAVCDPACGSGHFLLAAARRLGKELARIRTGEDEPRPEDFHLAVRDVISHCIYGVDLNPMAVDLCKLALWLEGHWAGKPLSFLDYRIRCGNSLIGVLDPNLMSDGIPDDAFTPVNGDEKVLAAALKKRNKQERTSRQRALSFEPEDHASEYANARRQLEAMSDDNAEAVRRKAEIYSSWRAGMQHSHDEAVADLWTAQFFNTFTEANANAICTTREFLEFAVDKNKKPLLVGTAQGLAQEYRFFHWRLEFPEVFERGGFDVILGNPPWDKIKLTEEEHWADDPYIAGAANKAQRTKRIEEYRHSDDLSKRQRVAIFDAAKRRADAISRFARASGRFPKSAVGDINIYALFAEMYLHIIRQSGAAGVVLPSGLATDSTTAPLYQEIATSGALVSFFEFENEGFFSAGQGHMVRFALCTIRPCNSQPTDFLFQGKNVSDIRNGIRHFKLSPEEIRLLNPNTLTSPIFQTAADAVLTLNIYRRVPVLIRDGSSGSNPWSIDFLRMFDMSNDSHLFRTARDLEKAGATRTGADWVSDGKRYLRLFEAKMIHLYNHRHGDFADSPGARIHKLPHVPTERLSNTDYLTSSHYWVAEPEVKKILEDKHWRRKWLLGWRDVTDARASERTMVAAVVPVAGYGDKFLLMLPQAEMARIPALVANLSSIPFDYFARQKVGGIALKYFTMKQLPVLPPDAYSEGDLAYITPRVLELVYTAEDMRGFAEDLGCNGPPFRWNPDRRATLRAELDAYFAHLYGFTRDELRYVLDPKDVFGETFPGETFRVLKDRELEQYGEFRTGRLVLEAFDQLAETERFRADIAGRQSALDSLRKKKTLVAVQ